MTPVEVHDLREELLLTIVGAQNATPRTMQQTIGPSGMGGPCERKIVYRLAGHPSQRTTPADLWRATVGTAVHAWLEGVFGRVVLPDGTPRYLVEQRVKVGQVGGVDVYGTADLYDRATHTVLDWKIPGPTSLKAQKGKGVSFTYRAQRNLYGLGVALAGHPVQYVGNVLLPSAGDLTEAWLDVEPFNPALAMATIARCGKIHATIGELGLEAAADQAEVADDYCSSCEWFNPAARTSLEGCRGARPARKAPPALTLSLGGDA